MAAPTAADHVSMIVVTLVAFVNVASAVNCYSCTDCGDARGYWGSCTGTTCVKQLALVGSTGTPNYTNINFNTRKVCKSIAPHMYSLEDVGLVVLASHFTAAP